MPDHREISLIAHPLVAGNVHLPNLGDPIRDLSPWLERRVNPRMIEAALERGRGVADARRGAREDRCRWERPGRCF